MNQKEIKKAWEIYKKALHPRFPKKDDISRFRNYCIDGLPDALNEIEHLREMVELAWKSLLMAEDDLCSRIERFDDFRNRYCELKIRDKDLPEYHIGELKEKP